MVARRYAHLSVTIADRARRWCAKTLHGSKGVRYAVLFYPPVRYACSCRYVQCGFVDSGKNSASHAALVRGSTAIPSSLSAISISSASNSSAVKRHNLSMACSHLCPDASVPLPSRSATTKTQVITPSLIAGRNRRQLRITAFHQTGKERHMPCIDEILACNGVGKIAVWLFNQQ